MACLKGCTGEAFTWLRLSRVVAEWLPPIAWAMWFYLIFAPFLHTCQLSRYPGIFLQFSWQLSPDPLITTDRLLFKLLRCHNWHIFWEQHNLPHPHDWNLTHQQCSNKQKHEKEWRSLCSHILVKAAHNVILAWAFKRGILHSSKSG